MDLRKERTRRSIINAFLELRADKPLERISVKELSELAMINKATFYSHYEDVYDLSRQLEDETIDEIIMSVNNLNELTEEPKRITRELNVAVLSHISLITILFSDSRHSILSDRIEQRLKEIIYESHPEFKTLEWDVRLTAVIQGSFHAFEANYKDHDVEELINIISEINEKILRMN